MDQAGRSDQQRVKEVWPDAKIICGPENCNGHQIVIPIGEDGWGAEFGAWADAASRLPKAEAALAPYTEFEVFDPQNGTVVDTVSTPEMAIHVANKHSDRTNRSFHWRLKAAPPVEEGEVTARDGWMLAAAQEINRIQLGRDHVIKDQLGIKHPVMPVDEQIAVMKKHFNAAKSSSPVIEGEMCSTCHHPVTLKEGEISVCSAVHKSAPLAEEREVAQTFDGLEPPVEGEFEVIHNGIRQSVVPLAIHKRALAKASSLVGEVAALKEQVWQAYLREDAWNAAKASSPAELSPAVRMQLWLTHGCGFTSLYGDDGEMQCNRAPFIDFKRDSEAAILAGIAKHNEQRRLAETVSMSSKHVCPLCNGSKGEYADVCRSCAQAKVTEAKVSSPVAFHPVKNASEMVVCKHCHKSNGEHSPEDECIDNLGNKLGTNWTPLMAPSLSPAVAGGESETQKWLTSPDSQGWWWHWDGDYDHAPFMYSVLTSLSRKINREFIAHPDSRWCCDVGGFWLRAEEPVLPLIKDVRGK